MPSIWWPYQSLMTMKSLADESYPLETGGMLLGYVADNADVVVRGIIGPGPTAKHYRHAFTPDSAYQIEILHHHYHATNGLETYLGDWHSHPGGTSRLSRTDKQTLASIAHNLTSGIKKPVMAILAGNTNQWHLGAVRFVGIQRKFYLTSYTLEELEHKEF